MIMTGEISKLRDVLLELKSKRLQEEFFAIQRYGAKQAKKLKLSEKDAERLVFEGR